MRLISATLLSLMFLAGTLAACDFGEPGRDDLAALEAEIHALIGDASAADVSFCREIAFGSKPCGGPWRYLVYSTQITDSTELAHKVKKYNRWESEINEREGRFSDCMFVGPPGVKLENGQCVAANSSAFE